MTSWLNGIPAPDLLLWAAALLWVASAWIKSAPKWFHWVAVPTAALLIWRYVPFEFSGNVKATMWVFTIASAGLLLATIRWVSRLEEYRWWYVGVLVLSALFWWVGESLGLRLGRYDYETAPISIGFPGGGTPKNADADPVARWIRQFFDLSDLTEVKQMPGCVQKSWMIPLPLLAFEAVLLMSFVRLSELRLKCQPPTRPLEKRLWEALSTAGLSAFMLIVVFAIFDPVVSEATWCGLRGEAPDYQHLKTIRLWRWILTDTHPGYWFGIPLTNYITWSLTAAVFGFLARLDDYDPGGIINKKLWERWFWVLPAFIAGLFAILIPLKALVDKVVVRGQDYLFPQHLFSERAWQFGSMLFLIGVAVRWMRTCHASRDARLDEICVAPHGVVIALCLAAILWEAVTRQQLNWWVLGVWALATAVTVAMFWPMRRSLVARTMTTPDREGAGVA